MRYAQGDLAGHAVALCNFGHCLARTHEYTQAAIIQEQAYILFKDVLDDRAGQVRRTRKKGHERLPLSICFFPLFSTTLYFLDHQTLTREDPNESVFTASCFVSGLGDERSR